MEILNAPGLNYTQRLTSGLVVHVDCHVSVDWSKSRPHPGAHGGRREATIATDPGLARTNHLDYWTQGIVVNVIVPAPPRNGHRSKLDGETERRRSQVIDVTTM